MADRSRRPTTTGCCDLGRAVRQGEPAPPVEPFEGVHLERYVGLELAQAFRRFGSRVTVVERNGA